MAEFVVSLGFIILFSVALRYVVSRRREIGTEPKDDGHAWDTVTPGRGPISRNAYWTPSDPGRRGRATRTGSPRRREDEPEYRVQGTTGTNDTRWDPFDPSTERKERLRAARRRAETPRRGKDDYYALLGIEPGASDRLIELAYRARAVEIHPDRFFADPARRREAEAHLKELNQAMQVLRDPVRRALYDASR